MNYLVYVEHSAENLQFFLWFRDYEKRFSQAKPSELALAPEWTQAMEEEATAKIRKDHADKRRQEPASAAIFRGTDFEKTSREQFANDAGSNPFSTPPTSSAGQTAPSLHSTQARSVSTHVSSYKSQAAEAFQSVGAKQPCKFRRPTMLVFSRV
jgi:hypothetical protein